MSFRVLASAAIVAALALGGRTGAAAAPVDFVQTVSATHPLVYLRLETASGASAVGTDTYATTGGVAVVAGAPIGVADNHALKFNGKDGALTTSHSGGIGSAGSMMAWVDVASPLAKAPHIQYVGGESQSGNDFDIQFENDGKLHFYTAAGSNLAYAPNPATLLNRWHMIVVTVNFSSGARVIYWDGKVAATDSGGGKPNKTSQFTLSDSSVFSGRFFDGAIDEAALWGRALSPGEVAGIYASTLTK